MANSPVIHFFFSTVEQPRPPLCTALISEPSYTFSASKKKSTPKHFRPELRWIYPLYGIPLEAPVEASALGVLLCGAGSQLERQMDVLLTGCVPGNQDCRGQEGERRFVMTLFFYPAKSASQHQKPVWKDRFFKDLSELHHGGKAAY